MMGFTINWSLGNPLSVYGELIPVLCNISLLSYLVTLYRWAQHIIITIISYLCLQIWCQHRQTLHLNCDNHLHPPPGVPALHTHLVSQPASSVGGSLWKGNMDCFTALQQYLNYITLTSGPAELESACCPGCWGVISQLCRHGSTRAQCQILHRPRPLHGDGARQEGPSRPGHHCLHAHPPLHHCIPSLHIQSARVDKEERNVVQSSSPSHVTLTLMKFRLSSCCALK